MVWYGVVWYSIAYYTMLCYAVPGGEDAERQNGGAEEHL